MDGEDEAMVRAIGRHVRAHALEEFLAQGRSCGWCRRPIRLRGVVASGDGPDRKTAFTSATLPDGVVLKACGARRETVCPSCATVYRDDARHLVRAGLMGGKGIDPSVASHPALFVTLTAPSFGAVHTVRDDGTCRTGSSSKRCPHGRATACRERHDVSDERLGTAFCPDCYNYRGAVLHNASTPELWRRTLIYAQRHLAARLGLTQVQASRLVRLSTLRVAELQRRGVVHLHGIVRADGPTGTAPTLSAVQLIAAWHSAAGSVRVPHRHGIARWGDELDVQVLAAGDDRVRRVAIYLAKYATKSSASTGALDHAIPSEEDLTSRNLGDHLRRMVETCWALGAEPGLGHLRRPASRQGRVEGSSSKGANRRASRPFGEGPLEGRRRRLVQPW